MRIHITYNAPVIAQDVISSLITDAGMSCGIGDWRNEKNGMFGAFHLATAAEQDAWEKFAAGKGALPEAKRTADSDYGNDWLQAAE